MDRSSSSQQFQARSSPNSYSKAWSPSMVNATVRKMNGNFRQPNNKAESWNTERSLGDIQGGTTVKRNLEQEFFAATNRMESSMGSYHQDGKNTNQFRLQKYQRDRPISLTNQDRLFYELSNSRDQGNKPNLLTTDYGTDKDNLMFAQNVTPGYIAREAKKVGISPLARTSRNPGFDESGTRFRRFQSLSEGNSPVLTRSFKMSTSEDYDPRYNHWQDTPSQLVQKHRGTSNGLPNPAKPNDTPSTMLNQRIPSSNNGFLNPSKPYYETPSPMRLQPRTSSNGLPNPSKPYHDTPDPRSRFNSDYQIGCSNTVLRRLVKSNGSDYAENDFRGHEKAEVSSFDTRGNTGQKRNSGDVFERMEDGYNFNSTQHPQGNGVNREGRTWMEDRYQGGHRNREEEKFSGKVTFAKQRTGRNGQMGEGYDTLERNSRQQNEMYMEKAIRRRFFGGNDTMKQERRSVENFPDKRHTYGDGREENLMRGTEGNIGDTRERGICNGSQNFREQSSYMIRENGSHIVGGQGSYMIREQGSRNFREQGSQNIREKGNQSIGRQGTHIIKEEVTHFVREQDNQSIGEQVTNSVRDIPERGYLKNSVTNVRGILKSREANSASLKRISGANECTVDGRTHTDCTGPKDKTLTATLKQCIVRELNLDQANKERTQRGNNSRMGVQFVLTGTGQSKEKAVDNIITLISESFTDCELDRRENELRMEKSRRNDRTIKSVDANSQRETGKEVSVGLTAGCAEVVGVDKNTNIRAQSNGIQDITAYSGFNDVCCSESVLERYSSTDNDQNASSQQTNIGLCSFEQIKRQLLHEAGLKEEKIDVTRCKTNQPDQRDQTPFVKTIYQNIEQQGLESDRFIDGDVYVVSESYGKIVYNNEKTPEDLIVSRTQKTQAKLNRNSKSPFIRTVYQDCGRGSARLEEINSLTSGRPVSPESDSIITAAARCNKENQPQKQCVRLRRRDRKLRYLSEPGNFSKHGVVYSRRFDVNSDRSADDMECRNTQKSSDGYDMRNSRTDNHGLTENALKAHTQGLKLGSPSVRRRPTLNQFFGKIQGQALQQDSSSDNSEVSCCSDSVLMIQKANKFNLTPVSGLVKDGSSNSAARAKRLKAWKSRHEKVPRSDRPSAAELLMKEQYEGARGSADNGVVVTAKVGNSFAENESYLKSSDSKSRQHDMLLQADKVVDSCAENESCLQSPESKTRLLHSTKPCGQANENRMNCVENNKEDSVFQEHENIQTRSNKQVMFSETASLHGAGSHENKSTTLKANKGNKVILNYTTDHDVNFDKENKEIWSPQIGFGSQDSFEEVFVEPELLSCTPQRTERGATNHEDQRSNCNPDLESKSSLNCEQQKDPLDTFVGSASAVLERVKRLKLKYNFKPTVEKPKESSSDLGTDSTNQSLLKTSDKRNESNNNLSTDSRYQTKLENNHESDPNSTVAKVIRVSLGSNTSQTVNLRSNDSRIKVQDSRIDHTINRGFRVQISKRSSCSLEELRPDMNLNTVKSPCHSSEEDLRFFKKPPRRSDNNESFSGTVLSTMTNRIAETDEGIKSACHSSEEDLRFYEKYSTSEMNDNKEKNSKIAPPTMTNKMKEFDEKGLGIRSPSEKLIQVGKSTNTNGKSHHKTSSSNILKSQAKQKGINRITAENDRVRLESGYESCTEREETKDCSVVENVTETLIRPDERNKNKVGFAVHGNQNIQPEAVNDGADLELQNDSWTVDPVLNCKDQLYLSASCQRVDKDQSDKIKRNFVATFKEKDSQEIAGLESGVTGVFNALSNDSERIFKDKDGEISRLIDPKDKIECRDLSNKRAGLTLKGKWIDGQSKANSSEVHEEHDSTNFSPGKAHVGGYVLGGPKPEQRRDNLDIASKEPAVIELKSNLIVEQSNGNSSGINKGQESTNFGAKKTGVCGDISDSSEQRKVDLNIEPKEAADISSCLNASSKNSVTEKDISCLNSDSRNVESVKEIYGLCNESINSDIQAEGVKSFDNDNKSNLELIARSSTFDTSGIIEQQLNDDARYNVTNITPFDVKRSDSADGDCGLGDNEEEMAYAKGVSDLKKHFEKWQPEQEKRDTNGTAPKDLQETDGSRKTPSKLHALKSMFESPSPTQSKWRTLSGEIRIEGKVTKIMTSSKLKNLAAVVNKEGNREESSPTLENYGETFRKEIEAGAAQNGTLSTAMQIKFKESSSSAEGTERASQNLQLEKGKEETIVKSQETRNDSSGQKVFSAQKVKKVPPPIKRKPSLKKKEAEKAKVDFTNEVYTNGKVDREIKGCDQSPVVSAKAIEGAAEHRDIILKSASAEESMVARKYESSQMTSIIPELTPRGHIDISQTKIDESEGGNKLNEKEHAGMNDNGISANSEGNVRENSEGVDGKICEITQIQVANESTEFVVSSVDSSVDSGLENGDTVSGVMDVKNRSMIVEKGDESVAQDSCTAKAKTVDYVTGKERRISAETEVEIIANKQTVIASLDGTAKEQYISEKSEANIAVTESNEQIASASQNVTRKEKVQIKAEKENALTFEKNKMILGSEHTQNNEASEFEKSRSDERQQGHCTFAKTIEETSKEQCTIDKTIQETSKEQSILEARTGITLNRVSVSPDKSNPLIKESQDISEIEREVGAPKYQVLDESSGIYCSNDVDVTMDKEQGCVLDTSRPCRSSSDSSDSSFEDTEPAASQNHRSDCYNVPSVGLPALLKEPLQTSWSTEQPCDIQSKGSEQQHQQHGNYVSYSEKASDIKNHAAKLGMYTRNNDHGSKDLQRHTSESTVERETVQEEPIMSVTINSSHEANPDSLVGMLEDTRTEAVPPKGSEHDTETSSEARQGTGTHISIGCKTGQPFTPVVIQSTPLTSDRGISPNVAKVSPYFHDGNSRIFAAPVQRFGGGIFGSESQVFGDAKGEDVDDISQDDEKLGESVKRSLENQGPCLADLKKLNVTLQIHRDHLEPQDINLGMISVNGMKYWEEIEDEAATAFSGHLKQIDENCLSLMKEDIKYLQIGRHQVALGEGMDLRNYAINGDEISCTMSLQDAGRSSLAWLSYQSLIPKRTLEKYLSLAFNHHCLIFCGPSGTGKSYLASNIAKVLASRIGKGDNNNVLDPLHTSNVNAERWEEIKKLIMQRIKDSIPVILVIDGFSPEFHEGMESLSTLLKQLGNRRVYIVAALSQSTDQDVAVRWQNSIRWIWLDNNEEPMKGLLSRYLRKKFLLKDFSLKSEELFKISNWISSLWKHLNRIVERFHSTTQTIGPAMFFSCPTNKDEIEEWFADLWNYSLAPYLLHTMRTGLKTFGQRCAWTDPLEWIRETYPWQQKGNLIHKLKKIRKEDVEFRETNADIRDESSKEQVRLMNFLRRLETLVDDDKKITTDIKPGTTQRRIYLESTL